MRGFLSFFSLPPFFYILPSSPSLHSIFSSVSFLFLPSFFILHLLVNYSLFPQPSPSLPFFVPLLVPFPCCFLIHPFFLLLSFRVHSSSCHTFNPMFVFLFYTYFCAAAFFQRSHVLFVERVKKITSWTTTPISIFVRISLVFNYVQTHHASMRKRKVKKKKISCEIKRVLVEMNTIFCCS